MTTSAADRLALQQIDFMEKVKLGVPLLHAALDVGWSRTKLDRLMRDKDFREQVEDVSTYRDESVEMVLYQKALTGHTESIKMWLENRRPERWRQAQKVDVQLSGGVSIAVVEANRETLRALIEQHGSVAVAALGPGSDILDAEVIEDGDIG